MRVTSLATVSAAGLASFLSCASDDPGPGPTEPPVACSAAAPSFAYFRDLDNTGGGGDLYTRIGPVPASSCTAGVRVFVARDGTHPTDAATALTVPAANTIQLDAGFDGGVLTMVNPGVDASGAAIVEGVAYRLHILAFGPEESTLLTSASATTLQNADVVRTISPQIPAGSGGLETDAQGNIYTADFGATLQGPPGNQIHRVTPEGEVSVWATGFVGASGNDRAENGDLFQSSIQGGSIQRVTPDGQVSSFATGIPGPVGIKALPGDTLIVAGCGDNTVRRVEPDGAVSTLAASSLFNCPNGITLASDGNYYIANFGNGWVHRISPQGDVEAVWQAPSGNAGHILWGLDALWVVDRTGNRLWKLDLEGNATPVAGTGARGVDDGPALEATLSVTNDVAFSPDFTRLYFNDVADTTSPTTVLNPVLVRALIFARDEG